MTANRETPAEPTSQTPSGTPSRRNRSHRRRHPAAGTRTVLAAGSVAATLGLTGVLWNAAPASSTGTDPDGSTSSSVDTSSPSSSTDDNRTNSFDLDEYDDDSTTTYSDDSSSFSSESSDDSDDSVDVAPSNDAPDTTSSAS